MLDSKLINVSEGVTAVFLTGVSHKHSYGGTADMGTGKSR